MSPRVYIFVDFWNFELDWNELLHQSGSQKKIRIDWKALPNVIVDEVSKKINSPVDYRGTNIYTSVSAEADSGLRRWFDTMKSFVGFDVKVINRKSRQRPIRCKHCKSEFDKCPSCGELFRVSVEKGVDTAIVTEMIQMAHDNAYDIAVLGSTDADLCQAIELVQKRFSKRVLHLSFPSTGVSVRNTCWHHFEMDKIASRMKRGD